MHDTEKLKAERFPELPAHCMSTSEPGIDEVDEWRDWTALDTTPDQKRIEDHLLRLKLSGRSILHVGVGNSSLAARLAGHARHIVGTTISPNEATHGASLNIPNYDVDLHNKYSGKALNTDEKFDFIVDNNPTTFCCCLHHLMTMMDFYERILTPDGQVLTDRAGLGWVVSTPGANPRWKFDFDDLAFVAGQVGLKVFAIDADLIALSRRQPPAVQARGPMDLARSAMRKARRILSRLLSSGS